MSALEFCVLACVIHCIYGTHGATSKSHNPMKITTTIDIPEETAQPKPSPKCWDMVDFDRIQVLSLRPMSNQKLLAVALDLTRFAPRSARASLGGYGAVAARTLDKCRAELAGLRCETRSAFLPGVGDSI
jgi:hypothetical protein